MKRDAVPVELTACLYITGARAGAYAYSSCCGTQRETYHYPANDTRNVDGSPERNNKGNYINGSLHTLSTFKGIKEPLSGFPKAFDSLLDGQRDYFIIKDRDTDKAIVFSWVDLAKEEKLFGPIKELEITKEDIANWEAILARKGKPAPGEGGCDCVDCLRANHERNVQKYGPLIAKYKEKVPA